MLNILVVLQKQSLLGKSNSFPIGDASSLSITIPDSFLPFDLESAFVSALVLLVAPYVDTYLLEDSLPWLQNTYEILNEMIYRGNQIAAFRKTDLDQLQELLSQWFSPDLSEEHDRAQVISHMPPVLSLYNEGSQIGDGNDQTAIDIMAVADSIDSVDVDWIAHAVTENSIW